MRSVLIIQIVALLLWGGCTDEGTGPPPTPTAGRVTITSRPVGTGGAGFSFETASILPFPNPRGQLPDVSLLVQINENGTITGVFLARLDSLVPTFRLLHQYASLDSAHSCFDRLAELPDTTYDDLALSISPGQIWAVTTRRRTFAKILILEARATIDSADPGTPTPYGETLFDWVYQPNGTRRF